MTPEWIYNPNPVWNEIKTYLADDTGELEKNGQFLGVFDGEEMAAVFMIKPMNAYCFEIHGGVRKRFWGKGVEISKLVRDVIFNSTQCLKLVAIIPEFNRITRRCVKKCGGEREGVLTKSYLKWARLHDQIVYGLTKGEYRCLQQQ
jgi:RimJ/RimL family protein N-acetyltransferase